VERIDHDLKTGTGFGLRRLRGDRTVLPPLRGADKGVSVWSWMPFFAGVQPNQRIKFHMDARYNAYDLGLCESVADVGVVSPRFSFGTRASTSKNRVRYLRPDVRRLIHRDGEHPSQP